MHRGSTEKDEDGITRREVSKAGTERSMHGEEGWRERWRER
jgi:hypothetical protein